MTSLYRKAFILALGLAAVSAVLAQEAFHGDFAEPRDGGNLDFTLSSFDGAVAVLVPRGHESEALGSGPGARRWRNMLFALRGVKGRIVTFHLPAQAPGGAMVHNMDAATVNLLEPVWSHDGAQREWQPFTVVDVMKPDAADTPGAVFPADSVVDNSGTVTVKPNSPRKEDYGWVFQNSTPFTEDVVYVSINQHYPVDEFYGWLENEVFTHPWVSATASETLPNSFLIGYQSGAAATAGAFGRDIPDTPLYAFKIRDPQAQPTKVVLLVSGQHPYEGQTKAVLEGALRWILDPHDPAAAAYRAEYLTLVYPFVNPTGELAGLWRGTAFEPRRDINRNWNTVRTDPLSDRGIDTVIIHKQAMVNDVAALAMGQPYAVVDLHQNYGDQLPSLHYVLHHTNALASAWVQRLRERAPDVADIVSNSTTTQTLRGFWQAAGAAMTLCIERSTYSTLAAERVFGREMMRAFAPEVVAAAPLAAEPAALPLPAELVATVAPTTSEPATEVWQRWADSFGGEGDLQGRRVVADSAVAPWSVELGSMSVVDGAAVAADAYTRALLDVGAPDATLQAEVTLLHAQTSAGLVLRALDRNNFYFFRAQATGWIFGRVVNNTATTLATGTRPLAVGEGHLLAAEVSGHRVTLLLNGQTVHTGALLAEAGASRFGLSSGTPAAFSARRFEVAVRAAASSAPELMLVAQTESAEAAPFVFHDTFSGRGTIAQRQPQSSTATGGPAWMLSAGHLDMIEGAAISGTSTVRAFVDAGTPHARVHARIRLEAPETVAGLMIRATDADNFYYFRIHATGWSFGRVVANTAYPIATARRSFAVAATHALEAETFGATMILKANGQVVHTALLPEEIGSTRFGLASGNASPFATTLFRVDSGAAVSLGGEGGRVLPPTPAPRRTVATTPSSPAVTRPVGPAGRHGVGGRRLVSLSAMRSATAD